MTQKVLAAFDKCKDSLAASELCKLTQDTLESRVGQYAVDIVPLSDGGEGFVQILTTEVKGEFIPFNASDSVGKKKEVQIGVCKLSNLSVLAKDFLKLPDEGKIGIIEMASIVGLADLKVEERNAWKTSSKGVGEVLAFCASLKLDAILLGIGGSSTNDMGVGALKSLGFEFIDSTGHSISFPSPETWSSVSTIKAGCMVSLPPLTIACDVRNPLLGPMGATHQFGKQKGLDSDARDCLEKKMEEMLALMGTIFSDVAVSAKAEGSGAAGGIGFGLGLAYKVNFVPGFDLISSWCDIPSKIRRCDILITGEGRFDKTSMQGKAPFELIRKAHQAGKKTYVFAGSVEEETKKICEKEYASLEIYEFGKLGVTLEDKLTNASSHLISSLNDVMFPN